jgi:anti-sigma factor RsiW
MDHTRFKANHTAALYVSGELDEHVQETFELHLMSCTSCVQDVEIWRAMSGGIRQQRDKMIERSTSAAQQPIPWRLAASFALIAIGSGAVGWYGRTFSGASLDDESVAVFNLPPVTRSGEDCVRLQIAPVTELIALRVPNADLARRLELTDAQGRPLEADSYSVRTQPDGSWLVRMRARQTGEIVRLQTREADGLSEPLGCILEAGRS